MLDDADEEMLDETCFEDGSDEEDTAAVFFVARLAGWNLLAQQSSTFPAHITE